MKVLAVAVIAGLSLSACVSMNNESMSQNDASKANQAVTQFPIEMALINIYVKPSNETLYSTVEGIAVEVNFETTPKGTVMFDGQRVQSSEAIATTKILGEIIDKSVGANYYTIDPLVFRGFTSDDEYSVATQMASVPKMAAIGSSSTYLTENVYSDSSKRSLINRYTQTWTLASASNNSAWLCINSSTNLLLADDPDGTVSECYKINQQGDILDSKIDNSYPSDEGMVTINFNRG